MSTHVLRRLTATFLLCFVAVSCGLWPGGDDDTDGDIRGRSENSSGRAAAIGPGDVDGAERGFAFTDFGQRLRPSGFDVFTVGSGSGDGQIALPRVIFGALDPPETSQALMRKSLVPGEPAKPKTGTVRWQRSKGRPHFARVYVGDGNALVLRRMRITVTIEGARARTVVDHVFYNPHSQRLEGTFEYPLPARASPSYYAMFLTPEQETVPDFFPGGTVAALPVGALADMAPAEAAGKVDPEQWGTLREARIVHREKARRAYEEIVRRSIDPALLEYAGGNTFRGRVFPIQPKGLNRVIVAYERHLDVVDGAVQYRLALPDCPLDLLHVTIVVDKRGLRRETLRPSGAARAERGDKIIYEHAWENVEKPIAEETGGAIVLAVEPDDPRVQVTTGPDPSGGGRSFYARVRPELPAGIGKPYAEHAVFLLDTSFSEEPDRFNANLKILARILTKDGAIRRFNVMCFDVGAAWVEPAGWVTNDAAGRKRITARLQRVMLEGATDLSAAVGLLDETRWDNERVPGYVFLLTDGQVNWGERQASALATRLEECALLEPRVFCYRTGLGAENLELFGKLTRRGGGVFNAFSKGMADKVGLAHRRAAFLVSEVVVEGARDVLVAGRQAAVYPGGEVVVVGRYGDVAPAAIVLRGNLNGEPKSIRVPVTMSASGTLADRAWAEIAVQQMLALDDPKLESLATAYAQRYRIGSRVTSFLVLEKDGDYEEFDVAKEASELAVADVAAFLAERYAKRPAPVARKAAWQAFVAARGPDIAEGRAQQVLALLHEQECKLPPGVDTGVILDRADAGQRYRAFRDGIAKQRADSTKLRGFLQEAALRIGEDRLASGVKALSTAVELHPGRSDAMRLVGYQLMSMGQSGPAAHVFDRVRLQRPFEPHSYRDLARSLELAYRFPLAAVQYEILLSGKWHSRFQSIGVVVREEYRRMLDLALKSGSLSSEVRSYFTQRRDAFASASVPQDLRVTISWNTDGTDVDLWVVEPGGEACGYSHPVTKLGGKLLDDLTSGYGPERYQIAKAPRAAGEFVVRVKYFSRNPNLIAGETHVEVVVERFAGSPLAETKRFQVVLTEKDQEQEVCRIRFD